MTWTTCEDWRGAMAMEALGKLAASERAGLRAHLDGCRACRDEASDLAAIAGALARVDAAEIAPTAAIPSALTEDVLGSLHRSARAARRRRSLLRGGVAAGLVAASLAALGIVALRPSQPGPQQRTEVLRGAPSVTASVVLTERPWGTSLALYEQGLPAGGLYSVSMLTTSGTWWATGTYRTVSNQPVEAQMTCALPLSQISGVRITNAAGVSVLQSYTVGEAGWSSRSGASE
jgi:predicted anti-sigma-YlaC factor YlaD